MQNRNTPEISVLMVTYNAGDFIEEAIQSILNQSFQNFELLIYNDGSTDNTKEKIDNIKDNRIRFIHNEVNKGLYYARNACLQAARGKYIAILDSDDIAMADRLKIQYEFMEKNVAVALCGSNAKIINSRGDVISDRLNKLPLKENILKAELFFRNIFVNSSTIFRRDIVNRLGGYCDMAPVEDYDLFVRIANLHSIYVFNESYVYYRRHGDNISKRQQSIGDLHLKEIKKLQLSLFGVDENRYGDVFDAILRCEYQQFEVNDYLELLVTLKKKNREQRKFPQQYFEKRLFEIWYDFILARKGKKYAAPFLRHKELFDPKIVSWKQLRKIIKLSVKDLLRMKVSM